VLGFGPGALSFSGPGFPGSARKTQNFGAASDYVKAIERGGDGAERFFVFGPRELKVLTATRGLATRRIDRVRWRELFHTDVLDDFGREIPALERANLIAVTDAAILLTSRGGFYADTVAGTFAWRRVALMRTLDRCDGGYVRARIAHDQTLDDSTRGPMG
jgi:coproporphyrinogen III oxidase-like Fe-S oxidoreductase